MQDVVVNWTGLDWLAIFMYLSIMILVGWYVSRKVRNSEDYLMAGRALSYPMVVATVAATWYGSGAVFGTAELAFNAGIAAFVVWCVPAHLGRIPLALWVAPRVRGVKENTIPALLGRLYARPVAFLGAVLIVCYSSRLMDIVSVGIMGNTVTGLPNWIIGAVIVGVVICYSMFGGLWSVVMTDVLQFFLMTSLTLLLLPGVWSSVGGFEGLRAALPAGHFSPTGGLPVSQLLVFFLLGFQVYADPAAYQRFGASNSAKTAKRAYLTCLLIWMAFDTVMTMLGLGARALYPELQGSKAFLTMAINAMPPFLTGLWICSILAVIMSTMSSFFLVGATTLTCDLIKPLFRPCMTDKGTDPPDALLHGLHRLLRLPAGLPVLRRAGRRHLPRRSVSRLRLRARARRPVLALALHRGGRLPQHARRHGHHPCVAVSGQSLRPEAHAGGAAGILHSVPSGEHDRQAHRPQRRTRQ